jgi:phospholipid/cholesterol/gamma-HCH transport system ATP-binding protein
LKGFENFDPADLSGGMKKRAGLARAMGLDPPLLFLDEPSAGLDPINSRRLDDLVLRIRDCLGTTFVVVTHELPQIYAIADNTIYLDPESKSMLCQGNPNDLTKQELVTSLFLIWLDRGWRGKPRGIAQPMIKGLATTKCGKWG